MPRVSVIIASYNRAEVLGQAIESVLAQTYRDFELIVVDDASTDSTAESLQPYRDRITYLRRDVNGGAAAGRNDGIHASSGEYIAFLDSDDSYLPNRLEVAVKALDVAPEYGGAYADMERLAADGSPLPVVAGFLPYQGSGWIFKEQLTRGAMHTNSVTLRRACFEEVGYFDESLRRFQDVHMWLRLTHRHPFLFLPDKVAVRRLRDVTSEFTVAAYEYPWRGLLKILQDIPDLTPAERHLVRREALLAAATHIALLRAADQSDRAREVTAIAAAERAKLPLSDRLLVKCLIAARRRPLAQVAGMARWARRRFSRPAQPAPMRTPG